MAMEQVWEYTLAGKKQGPFSSKAQAEKDYASKTGFDPSMARAVRKDSAKGDAEPMDNSAKLTAIADAVDGLAARFDSYYSRHESRADATTKNERRAYHDYNDRELKAAIETMKGNGNNPSIRLRMEAELERRQKDAK